MNPQLFRQRHDVLATLQSLDRHSTELNRIPFPSSLFHLQFLPLQSVPYSNVSSEGFSPLSPRQSVTKPPQRLFISFEALAQKYSREICVAAFPRARVNPCNLISTVDGCQVLRVSWPQYQRFLRGALQADCRVDAFHIKSIRENLGNRTRPTGSRQETDGYRGTGQFADWRQWFQQLP